MQTSESPERIRVLPVGLESRPEGIKVNKGGNFGRLMLESSRYRVVVDIYRSIIYIFKKKTKPKTLKRQNYSALSTLGVVALSESLLKLHNCKAGRPIGRVGARARPRWLHCTRQQSTSRSRAAPAAVILFLECACARMYVCLGV